MDWVKLVIPLIAVAVWIVSNIANQQKETRRQPRVPPPPPRPRNPLDTLAPDSFTKPSEENKYREELDRKREKKPSAAKTLSKTLRTKRLESVPKPPRTPVVLRPGRPPTAGYTGAEQRQGGQAEIGIVLEVPVLPIQPIGKIGEPAKPVVKATPVAIKNMRELLKHPESLATAFLLREVLDLPVSKRARRRM
jgi:hypothetical protein